MSDCLQDSKILNKNVDNSESLKETKIIKTIESSMKMSKNEKNKSSERKDNGNELMKIVTEDQMSHSKLMKSLENSKSHSKGSKDSFKAFNAFKDIANSKQSKTIDQKDKRKETLNSPSQKLMSPTMKKKGENIIKARTEETSITSNQNMSAGIKNIQGNQRKPNKSNSNERSKSKKKNACKEKVHPRPKTSKGQRKQGNIYFNI